MIASIRGSFLDQGKDWVTVEVGGVGFEVLVSTRTLARMPAAGKEVHLYTHMVVRQDALTLFGFETADEKAMFLKLIAVSGVGPKVALNVLSGMSTSELAIALVSEDARAISRIPGIGKKTAERLILELKEKVDSKALKDASPEIAQGVGDAGLAQEAVRALMALGYSSVEASRAVGRAGSAASVEEMIMMALRGLDTGR